jgi:two-component system, OmpR family, sensor histidine kinase BaeS
VSFRLRVLVLTILIAVTATAATAWLTLRQASHQLTETITASRQQAARITDDLAGYGREHATWARLDAVVGPLARRTGQRIQVLDETGRVLADSDAIAGTPPRPVAGPALLIDPAPTVRLAPALPPSIVDAVEYTWAQVTYYHLGLRYAACLTEAGVPVRITPTGTGVPDFTVDPAGDQAAAPGCQRRSHAESQPLLTTSAALFRGSWAALPPRFRTVVEACKRLTGAPGWAGCFQSAFAAQIRGYAAPRVQAYLGARNEKPAPLPWRSTALAALLVAAVAVLATLLLSRRVLRPIGALTAASRRLGAGELTERVHVAGRDELADLTREFNRMAAALQDSEDRQRRMVADVAHELRTPLANLRGYLEALQDGVLAPTPDLFASLHDEALLQQRIVEDLQDLALAEAGRLGYHRGPLDLADLARTCATAHTPAAAAAGLDLRVEAAGPVHTSGDATRLRQALANLVRNAIAATPPGGTVTIRARAGAVIEVEDTGTGIAPADLPHVFDRFWRADPSRTTPGAGLGLAIARQIVTDHAGTITATSREAAGSTVTIRLPPA